MNLDITKEWFKRQADLEGDSEIGAGLRACHCIGRQNGQPVCPCAMQSVTIENGRYVERRDLGPATETGLRERMEKAADAQVRRLQDR